MEEKEKGVKKDEFPELRLLRLPEAAAILGMGRATLYEWIHKNWITATVLPSGRARIALTEVERIIKEGKGQKLRFPARGKEKV